MRILILNWRDIKNPKKGGAEIILYELGKQLIKKGHSVVWFCSSFENAPPQETVDGIKILRQGNELSVYILAFLYYRRLLVKPDIVLDCVNTICWQTPLYARWGKKILYANQAARKVFFYEYPWPIASIGFILEPLQYLTYKNTKAICYSQSIKNDLVSFGLKEKNISVFLLGIDHERYKPGKKFKDPTFVFVARFAKNKRAEICIQAMRLILQEFPEAALYLVGYGEEEGNLRSLIDKLGLAKSVFIANKNNNFLKKDPRDIKVSLMRGAWALVLPSVKEGWGMVVTEAASCGTPAIVSNVTGLRDSTIHNETGIVLSESPKPEELADAMARIIKDSSLRERLSRGCVAFAKKFSWEKSFNRFYQLLTDKT